jgi:hypothetical protein
MAADIAKTKGSPQQYLSLGRVSQIFRYLLYRRQSNTGKV